MLTSDAIAMSLVTHISYYSSVFNDHNEYLIYMTLSIHINNLKKRSFKQGM